MLQFHNLIRVNVRATRNVKGVAYSYILYTSKEDKKRDESYARLQFSSACIL